MVLGQEKNMRGSGYPTYPNFLSPSPYPNLFSPNSVAEQNNFASAILFQLQNLEKKIYINMEMEI